MARRNRQQRIDRYVSNSSELIVARVEDVVRDMGSIIKQCYQMDGQLTSEIGSDPALQRGRAIFARNRSQIYSVPQDQAAKGFKAKDIEDIRIALATYTVESALYKDFNNQTRLYLTRKQQNYKYGIFMTHLWCGTTYFYGSPRNFPPRLYRGMRGGIGSLRVGQTFAFPSIVSTTGDLTVAEDFADGADPTIFVIIPTVTTLHCIGLNNHSEYAEDEYLFAPTHSYTVTRIYRAKGTQGQEYRVVECTVKTVFNI